MDPRYAKLTEALQTYFDGLYFSDVERLSSVFHPQAHYATATQEPLLHLDMPAYFELVWKRVSPASKGEARSDEIVSITFAGPVTALAIVRCSILPRRFTDFLTFIKTDGQWRIISKVFHFEVD